MQKNIKKVCYIGFTSAHAITRNALLVDGLRSAGVEVESCVETGPGKYGRLRRCLKTWAKEADVIVVGFSNGLLVPFVAWWSRKPIVFNASHSLYEGIIEDRRQYAAWSWYALKYWCTDFVSFLLSDFILVESRAQKAYLHAKFFVPERKMAAFYTGADDRIFYPDGSVSKADTFTVAFRGAFLPATGVEEVIKAAALLKDEDIEFYLYGRGQEEAPIREQIAALGLSKVYLVTAFLSPNELHSALLRAHILLGNFSSHRRLEHTIQNKLFEGMALGMPIVTRDSPSSREMLEDGVNCLLVPPRDPEALARGIRELQSDAVLSERLGRAARARFEELCSPRVVGARGVQLIEEFFS